MGHGVRRELDLAGHRGPDPLRYGRWICFAGEGGRKGCLPGRRRGRRPAAEGSAVCATAVAAAGAANDAAAGSAPLGRGPGEAHLAQAVLRKKVIDAFKGLGKDVNFDCNEKGIQVQSRDSSHVALVSLLPRESALSSPSASGRYRRA